MADKSDFSVPELGETLKAASFEPGAMSHSEPFQAKPALQEAVGYPGELIENWHEVAIGTVSYTHLTLPTKA